MPRKKYTDLPFVEVMRLLKQSTMDTSKPLKNVPVDKEKLEQTETLEQRVEKIFGIVDKNKRKSTDMLFFVMYDIESNKVRNLVFKYLKKSGCINIQNSVFLGDLEGDKFNKIKEDLRQVQACYDNNDSILIVPISTDYLKAMKIIGKQIDVDIVMRKRNTLFF